MSMRFAPFTDEQAELYLAHSQEGYVADLVTAGALDEGRARLKASLDYASLAYEGETTYVAAYAEIDGVEQWVGAIGWGLRGFDAPHEEPTLYIYDLEVFEAYRRRGFGEGMLAHAAASAEDAGAHAVRLTVWAGNDGAKALYRSVGFQEEQSRMRMRLPGR